MIRIIVHDWRLMGYPKHEGEPGYYILNVGARTSLIEMVSKVKKVSDENPGSARLDLVCHGWEDDYGFLGHGLALCQESLKLDTVHLLAPLRHTGIGSIVVHSCGAAQSHWWDYGRDGDGALLMNKIADYTGAVVIAADDFQRAYMSNILGWPTADVKIDFCAWEGNVFMFYGTGGEPSKMGPNHYNQY